MQYYGPPPPLDFRFEIEHRFVLNVLNKQSTEYGDIYTLLYILDQADVILTLHIELKIKWKLHCNATLNQRIETTCYTLVYTLN